MRGETGEDRVYLHFLLFFLFFQIQLNSINFFLLAYEINCHLTIIKIRVASGEDGHKTTSSQGKHLTAHAHHLIIN